MTEETVSMTAKRMRRVRSVVLGAIVLAGSVVSIEVAVDHLLGDCAEARRAAASDDRIASQWGPRVADKMVQRAQAAMARGDLETADRKLQVALEWNPADAEALATLAELRFEQGHYHKAAKFAASAVKAQPERASHRMLLGDAYAKSGRFDHAAAQYQIAADLGDERALARLDVLPAPEGYSKSSSNP